MGNNTTGFSYRVLFNCFPLVEAFAQRVLPKGVAVNVGHRVLKLRVLFDAIEVRRGLLIEQYALKGENGHVVTDERGAAEFGVHRAEFEAAWKGTLDGEIEDFPVFPRQLTIDDLPEDVTPLEVEALLRLRLLEVEEA